jgi:hypothetical protein
MAANIGRADFRPRGGRYNAGGAVRPHGKPLPSVLDDTDTDQLLVRLRLVHGEPRFDIAPELIAARRRERLQSVPEIRRPLLIRRRGKRSSGWQRSCVWGSVMQTAPSRGFTRIRAARTQCPQARGAQAGCHASPSGRNNLRAERVEASLLLVVE